MIRLAAEPSETDIKALSKSGELAQYRVLHFATHGLPSGDVERMAQRQGEPALVLTPPDKPANPDDDGLLMASEVATLKLNADWVVMSACNTAAGGKIGAQALSGLARAFLGRALLASLFRRCGVANHKRLRRARPEPEGRSRRSIAERHDRPYR